jgi:phenylalanyl-tRNA synthetase beta chain
MKVVHSWLKDYLGDTLPEPARVEELFNFHAFEVEEVLEVAGEQVIDVDVLPNRSSDCLCHRGLARELATIMDVELSHDPLREDPNIQYTNDISVTISDADACPRFSASLVTGIKVGPSPKWLQQRLEALGQRPINNVVDATNYVMYAIGQPLHAYDAELFPKADGQWRFGVRYARAGETVSLLAEGGKDEDRIVELSGSELLIVDESSDTPIGLAGVKGGRYAGVHDGTTSIIIEAAHFDPIITRTTARRLGIVIDASKRFENEPSRELPLYAQSEIVRLIADIAGGTYEGTHDLYCQPREESPVTVRVDRVNRLLGLSLPAEEVKSVLVRTGSTVTDGEDAGVFTVVGPWERTDLTIEEDFIEEVGRIHGLDSITSVVPEAVPLAEVNAKQFYTEAIRTTLIAEGFSEVITSSFQKKGKIQLQNALASDKSYVRANVRKNLNAVLDANIVYTDLLGVSDIRAFEIGTVFEQGEGGVSEHLALAIGVRTKGSGYSPKDDAPLQSALEHVSATLGVELQWQTEQGIAEVNLTPVLAQLPPPTAYPESRERKAVQFRPISPFPAVARDIALWVNDDAEPRRIMELMAEVVGGLCVRVDLFDEFTKDDRRSLAFRIVFQSDARTLTDAEVNTIMDKLYKRVAEEGWEVR